MSLLLEVGKRGENGVVYFYNCGDYIDEDLLAKFTKETGIKVDYSTYDTNEIMYQKLKVLLEAMT